VGGNNTVEDDLRRMAACIYLKAPGGGEEAVYFLIDMNEIPIRKRLFFLQAGQVRRGIVVTPPELPGKNRPFIGGCQEKVYVRSC